MPLNKYRSLTHPLIYLLIFVIPLSLYILALVIALIALLLGAFTHFSCDNYLMNGLLVVADTLVDAGNKVLAGSMCLNDNNQDQQLQSSLDASGITNQPSIITQPDNRQNQYPMMVPNVMPINQYNNTAYQHQQSRLQQRVDSPSSTVDYPKSGFTYEELLVATNMFSAQNFLGEGGFGFVHRGILYDGRVVAIKQLSDNRMGQREFKAEVEVLSRVHHQHLVQYFGCCIAQDKRMIVCEYMPNKTVDYHLHGLHGRTLNWHNRLKISIGAAKGLSYLHEECQPRIIHRDIKAANILLDPSFEAKVADFGLAKIIPDDVSQIVASNLMGTRGYLAPELFSVGEIREKSDTYAFGVVLLELITGKKPIITLPAFSEELNPFETLANWARPLLRESLQNGSYDSLLDSQLCNVYNSDEMKRMIACAAACVQISPHDRPSMSKVALVLAGQASPDDLFIGVESTEIPTAPTSSTYFEESMSRTN